LESPCPFCPVVGKEGFKPPTSWFVVSNPLGVHFLLCDFIEPI
jgi:hypothetical protein